MEPNVPSLHLVPLVFFVLSAPLCSANSGNMLNIVPISDPETWTDAQTYCREHHGDLVTIRNLQEAQRLTPYEGWIGLRRTRWMVVLWKWRWSSGDESSLFTLWDSGEPHTNKHCALKHQSHLEWKSKDCAETHPFLCGEHMTLVLEKKTWEEALQHCRELQTDDGTRLDLVSLPEVNSMLLDDEAMKLLETSDEELWVGLRFLAGEWLWMSGRPAKGPRLPVCPAQQQHCGALVHTTKAWKIMNCGEERAFLCGTRREKQAQS